MSVLIYPLTPRHGILETGIAAAVAFVLILILTFSEAGRIIDRSFLAIVKSIAPAVSTAVGSLTMVSLVLLQQLISHILAFIAYTDFL